MGLRKAFKFITETANAVEFDGDIRLNQKRIVFHDSGSDLANKSVEEYTVGTSQVEIAGLFEASHVVVTGRDGADQFIDVVIATWNNSGTNTHTVVSSAERSTPASRSYDSTSGALELSMSSGTYDVTVSVENYTVQ